MRRTTARLVELILSALFGALLFSSQVALAALPNIEIVSLLIIVWTRVFRTGAQKDIHEKDVEYLNRSRAAADYCAARLGWHSLECVQEGGMRSIEEIHNEIMETLKELF